MIVLLAKAQLYLKLYNLLKYANWIMRDLVGKIVSLMITSNGTTWREKNILMSYELNVHSVNKNINRQSDKMSVTSRSVTEL